ncbi:helix-turn-helix domain-containing protein [Ulvibacterium sp.]|uniref:winged helix-turn-helix transcriptional regulator n=1 Tax=Ulvibacterium sp. TaxID=2665914 RepID=UPI00260669C3|nr:helix-turn-helix domain-containing protein [Ulvibacterium sp.]
MEPTFRCSCAITSAIDILGDKWALVIVKQMLFEDAETFKDFTESKEGIATNILSAKLKFLEGLAIISKSQKPDNRKTNYYHLTAKGIALTPVIIELALWSHENIRTLNPTIGDYEELEQIKKNKEKYCRELIENYTKKLATT